MADLKAGFERVLAEYQNARAHGTTDHEMARFVAEDLEEAVRRIVDDDARYKVKGSAGQGNVAKGPWIAVFDRTVTENATSGYYVVFLFREDLTGVYLSLNQGYTDLRKQYKASVEEVLQIQARDMAARVDKYPPQFLPGPIQLSKSGGLTRGYELGSALAVFYARGAIPVEDVLQADLRTMLDLYQRVIASKALAPTSPTDDDSDLPPEVRSLEEDLTNYRLHKRIERDAKIAPAVKAAKGYTCEVCDLNFESLYGEIGKEYIEAHHLQPVSTLKNTKLRKDVRKDFAVLCSNCHRMIHRSGRPADVGGLRAIVRASRRLPA